MHIYPHLRSRRARQGGFTLMEMMIVLGLAGVMLALAVPNFSAFTRNNRLTSAANDLLASITHARTEAIKRQESVAVCASANPTAENPTCSYGAFSGWIVFEDGDRDAVVPVAPNWQRDVGEPVIARHDLLDASVIVRTSADGIVSFNWTGFANFAGPKAPTREVAICSSRIYSDTPTRAVRVTQTGRARATRDAADVTAVLTFLGRSTCQ
jgi:prepilin-type N-terminal cleavage/methylation domain-containing protein